MVTHERALAERYAGRIVTLADGRIERIEQRPHTNIETHI
jgi:ABC-type sulfate/molybdate transport systems ATPase subunit